MPATDAPALAYRWATPRDLPAMADCAADAGRGWDAEFVRRRVKHGRGVAVVLEWRGRLAGWAMFDLLPSRLRVVAVAVHPELRGIGVGRLLAAHLKGLAAKNGRRGAVATVAETDGASLRFLRAAGFAAVRVLRAAGGGPDGVVMEWMI